MVDGVDEGVLVCVAVDDTDLVDVLDGVGVFE